MRWIDKVRATLLALGLLGCGGNGGAPAPASTASAAPIASASASAPAEVPRLHLVGHKLGLESRLYPLGPTAALKSGTILLSIDDKGLHQDPALYREARAFSATLGGRAPDAVFHIGLKNHLFRWADRKWAEVRSFGPKDKLLGVIPFARGRAAVLASNEVGALRWITSDPKDVGPSAPRVMEGGGADAGEPSPRVAVEPASGCWPASGAEAGQIVMVGHDPRKLRTILVERWAGSATESTLAELPKPRAHEDIDLCALAVGAGEAWVYGVGRIPYLARFDGKTWTREDPPGDERIVFMTAGDDGTVLLGLGEAVYRRASGAWQKLDIPEHKSPFASAAIVAGQIWVGTTSELFGPETPYSPIEDMYFTVESDGDLGRAPLTPMCATPYVVLQKKVPPARKEFPDVVAKVKDAIALDGVELVTEFNGKFTDLGARVPSYALATALAKKAEGVAYCHAPQVVKTIPLSP